MMRRGSESEAILSFSQQKLGALLTKTKELLPFAADDECENAFALLADFAQGTLEHKDERRTSQFDGMKLEELLKLRKGSQTRSDISHVEAAEAVNEEEEADEVEDDEYVPKGDKQKDKQQKRKAVESLIGVQPPRKRDAHDSVSCWDIVAFPLVGKLTSITVEPSVRIEFISKPGGQGNLAYNSFYADQEKLFELDELQEAKARAKAMSRLEIALEAYFSDDVSVPQALLVALEQCRWARDFVARHPIGLPEPSGSPEPIEKEGEC